jgi:hypothetical protein
VLEQCAGPEVDTDNDEGDGEGGHDEHQMTARPYTRSEDMQRQQRCAQDVTRR